ncbi:MAG: DUF433 domain-containing protein [Nostoc sp. ChiSLP02]|nr:DUF433 domain-containing protein [Nostoc sp. DedSLP05]MDZ8098072.1 DUF433 domain-containing protein [Nostoc sp. DedSLP01]MDZ8189322.1 DUF433 domain-containing protein [Nostoc sp. ChiSLP02]
MQLEDYFTFLAPDDIRLKGSRIGIETILYEYIYRARTAEEIAQIYPSLSIEQVYATILYYHHEKEKVSKYIADWLEWTHQMEEEQRKNPHPGIKKLMELKAAQKAKKLNDDNSISN